MFRYDPSPEAVYDNKSEYLQGFDLDMLDDMLAKDKAEETQTAKGSKPESQPAPSTSGKNDSDSTDDKPISRFGFHKGGERPEHAEHAEHDAHHAQPHVHQHAQHTVNTGHHEPHHEPHSEAHHSGHHHAFAASIISEVYK